jgi:ech hydrogenase subunit E
MSEKQVFRVPIGPQHPALKEPSHFEFLIDGETVVDATVRLGYAHRGIEKATESRSWTQNLYLLERICGICSHIHATAYALGVEKLAGVEAPPRAQAIRSLGAEMERIHSHLLWLGVTAHEGGFETLFMHSWRERELIMDALEALSGNRVHYSINVLGGVKVDVTNQIRQKILDALDKLDAATYHWLEILNQDASFLQRTSGVATISKDAAVSLGLVGPTARASGIAVDIRSDAPYAAYKVFAPEMVLDTQGDLQARCTIRLRELLVTYQFIRQLLANLPESELTSRMKRRLPAGDVIQRVEAPRGELLYYIASAGGDNPSRVKVRTPTFANWGAVLSFVIGQKLADVPMILAGIDPCFSCNDRAIHLKEGKTEEGMSWSQLRQYGIDYYRKGP